MELTQRRLDDMLAEARKTLYMEGFDIIRTLGRGGFGQILEVENRQYQQRFAVKLMDIGPEQTGIPESFVAEINALQNLTHPHVITCYRYFRSESVVYIVLEYCSGGSIKDVLDNHGPIGPPQIYDLCRQLVSALAICHARNIAHRDVKPANILIDSYGRAKLADFGLACSTASLTGGDIVQGSLPYLAPEVILGQPADPRVSDIWSLAVTFYEMIAGRLPWSDDGIMRDEILSGKIPFPAQIPRQFQNVLWHMFKTDPTQRWTCADIEKCALFQKDFPPQQRRMALAQSKSAPATTTRTKLGLFRAAGQSRPSLGFLRPSQSMLVGHASDTFQDPLDADPGAYDLG
jgi:serine/threonine protein kinase